MKTVVKKILYFLFIITVLKNTAFSAEFSNSWIIINPNQSIKELKSWLIELNKNKDHLNSEFFLLNQNQKLKEFFREDLIKPDINEIEIIIKSYIEQKKDIETRMKIKASSLLNTENERIELLNAKKNFYKNLLAFIKKEKIDEYIEYISQDVKILKEQWELSEKLIIQNEIIVNKVWVIEEKIKEHREYLNEKFSTIINDIINQKINLLITNPKFLELNTNWKELVLNKIIIKVQITISTLEKKEDKTDALIKKLDIYRKVHEELIEIKNNLIN